MIALESFSVDWINSHRKEKKYARINPPVLEKMIYALNLLEALIRQGLKFTFKGGTSLVLLLPEPKRFSVDIDILTRHSREELEAAFSGIIDDGIFKRWELDVRRSYKDGVPKAHYFFYFNSQLNKQAGYVLLDILFEVHRYPVIINSPVNSSWIRLQGDPLFVESPSIESILGDKLTAFAPNTTGVPYGRNKSIEIVKQLHDVGHLFDHIDNMRIVASSFFRIVEQEIKYRALDIAPDQVLDDVIATALLIGQTEKHHDAIDRPKYAEIVAGLDQFGSFLMTGSYYIDAAIEGAAKAAYLAAKLKAGNFEPLQRYGGEVTAFQFETMPYNTLNRLRKIRNGSLFYWWKVAGILAIK